MMPKPTVSLKGLLPKTAFAMVKVKKITNSESSTSHPEAELSFSSLAEIEPALRAIGIVSSATPLVMGEGDSFADLLFVGDMPTAEDLSSQRPFMGAPGQLLEKMIEAMGLKREEVFLTTVLKHRPSETISSEEIETSLSFLRAQLKFLKPKVIVALGPLAANSLLGSAQAIESLRGKFHRYEGVKLMPTFHPDFLLKNAGAKKETWDDLKQVMKELGLQGR